MGIWYKVLEFDPSLKVDLSQNPLLHFKNHLRWGLEMKPSSDDGGIVCSENNSHCLGQVEAARQICALSSLYVLRDANHQVGKTVDHCKE